jgi:hypothetical protein
LLDSLSDHNPVEDGMLVGNIASDDHTPHVVFKVDASFDEHGQVFAECLSQHILADFGLHEFMLDKVIGDEDGEGFDGDQVCLFQ